MAITMVMKKLKKLFGGKQPPRQIPIEEEYVVIKGSDEPPAYMVKEDESVPMYDREEKNIIRKEKKKISLEEKESDDFKDLSDIKKELEKEKEETKIKIIHKKIMPKLLTIRINKPNDFIDVRNMVEHDVIIIIVDLPLDAIVQDFLEFKRFLETMSYKLGKIDEHIFLAYKVDVELSKYPTDNNIKNDDAINVN